MTAPLPTPRESSRAELITLSEKDINAVARFIAVQSGRSADGVASHLHWFLLENPARRPQDSIGFGLRSADHLVGCILCSPQLFCYEKQQIRLMGSSSFYVDDRHRGHGGRIFLQYCRLAKDLPLFGTSANADAAALWKAAGAKPIPGSDSELFGVLRWPPVAEELAHRRKAGRALTRLAGSSVASLAALFRPLKVSAGSSSSLTPVSSAEEASSLLIHNLPAKLTALRDLKYLHWRYFSGHDRTTAVFSFRLRVPDQPVMVTVNQRRRGYRGQINTLSILDVYPEVSPMEWLRIGGALSAHYEREVDAIVLRNQDRNREEMFCEQGFQKRMFDAPIGWFLDKAKDRAKQLAAMDWYAVPADGDGLI
jgi:hypothetical protein